MKIIVIDVDEILMHKMTIFELISPIDKKHVTHSFINFVIALCLYTIKLIFFYMQVYLVTLYLLKGQDLY